jgi:Ser/Thr protein kinase RdoA (MazF antagonist)
MVNFSKNVLQEESESESRLGHGAQARIAPDSDHQVLISGGKVQAGGSRRRGWTQARRLPFVAGRPARAWRVAVLRLSVALAAALAPLGRRFAARPAALTINISEQRMAF